MATLVKCRWYLLKYDDFYCINSAFLAIINNNIQYRNQMDGDGIVLDECPNHEKVNAIVKSITFSECIPLQEKVELQICQYSVKSALEQFDVYKNLNERQGSTVMLLKRKKKKQLLIAKITQLSQNNLSTSIHLEYEIQFYKKMKKKQLHHLAIINNIYQNQNKYVRLMEYACRGDLIYYVPLMSNLTNSQKISQIQTVKNILWQVVIGLQEVHSLSYVYRDLKPANILITHEGKIKLCDFGLVAPFGIIDFSVCGTPEYMAPQRLSDKRGTVPVNQSIDLWALGVLAYQLLMGYTPYQFDGQDIENLLENIYGGYVNFDENLPNECRHFVFNLLQTNPKKRMSLEKVKQHAFFRNFQQQPLLGSGCKCQFLLPQT